MEMQRYPLSWPQGWKRTANQVAARFSREVKRWDATLSREVRSHQANLTVSDAVNRVTSELRAMGIPDGDFLVSTNIQTRLDGMPYSNRSEPSDTGAAVYWRYNGKNQCMAIDQYTRVADNLAAIAATLGALRSIQRHGGGAILDRAFQGFAQLPAGSKDWREVLGFQLGFNGSTPSVEQINERFRDLAKNLHPDKETGNHDAMTELNRARDQAIAEIED